MLPLRAFLPGVAAALLLITPLAQAAPGRTPVNQVFQFTQTADCTAWTDGSKTTATAYLWIPEHCSKLRGLIILCANVPENMLAGHPAIRAACAANDLGIIWCPHSFYNFKARGQGQTDVAFLQQLLTGLAEQSGYAEVATVPWIPMGESGHLLMVDALVENAPDRCIAGVWIKNCHLPPTNRVTPALVLFGSAQEWSQDKGGYSTHWNDIGGNYATILSQRQKYPAWPLSFVIDGTSGHFDCSERLTQLIARYVDLVAKARLAKDGSNKLNPVSLDGGYLADLPVPGHENHPVLAYSSTPAEGRDLPWYFDQAFAREAQSIAAINWHAKSQLPAFIDAHGAPFPFSFNGISWITLNHQPTPLPDGTIPPMLEAGTDGITFTLNGKMLDKTPANFRPPGEPLAQAPGEPASEWLCGDVEPLGNNQFRIAIDRNWPSPIYVAMREGGTDTIRATVQPGQIARDMNTDGASQSITFPALPDVKAGATSLPLAATASSGLPVRYFVGVGPAIIQDGALVFTPIPPRAKFPITVQVGAWQWGRYSEPKIKRAEIVTQTFHITAP